jgi:quercetin dioxygenase-like cupin family protein
MKIAKHDEMAWTPVSHDPDILKQVILANGDADNVTQVSQTMLEPGQSTQPHVHKDMTEIYTLLSGNMEFTVDAKRAKVGGPSTVVIHPGEEHSIRNSSDEKVSLQYIGILSSGPAS